MITEPAKSLGALLVYFLFSYGGAWAVAKTRHLGESPLVGEGPAWFSAFSDYRPEANAIWTTVELRDGRRISGSLRDYSWGKGQPRELLLWEPIVVESRDGTGAQIDDKFIVVKDDDILYVSGDYLPGHPPRS